MDYNKDMHINEDALDVEWLQQPELALKWGIIWAEAQQTFTQVEEKIKLVRAELIQELLDSGVKTTVASIEAYYRTHKKHKAAKEEWVKAQYDLNIADIAKWQISTTRKEALENLVKLHGQSYFASPSMPRNLHDEVERTNSQKEVDQKVGKGMKRKKKKKE